MLKEHKPHQCIHTDREYREHRMAPHLGMPLNPNTLASKAVFEAAVDALGAQAPASGMLTCESCTLADCQCCCNRHTAASDIKVQLVARVKA